MLTHDLGGGAALCPLEPWQAAEFHAHIEEHRDHLGPWLPWGRRIRSDDEARAFLQRYADGTATDGPRLWAIRIDGVLVGGILFRVFDVPASMCEVGVWLAPSATGRGIVTRACTALIDWAVLARGMRRVEWHCVPENLPSRAVAGRLGMSLEGTQRAAFEHDDRLWDVELWAILAEEWRAR